MAIKELTKQVLGKTKSGWTWDKRRELWTTWEVDTVFNGERHKRRGFRTQDEAKKYLEKLDDQERLQEIGVIHLIKYPTVKALLDAHLETIESHQAKVSAKRIFDKFLTVKSLPTNVTLNQLSRKHFKDFADLRISEGIKAESASREITDISSAIHKAGDYFEGLEKWNVPPTLIYRPSFEPTVRERVVSSMEYEKLISYLLEPQKESERDKDFLARRRTGLVVYFGLLTGLRHGEISGVEKINFNQTQKSLKAKRFKTRKSGVRWTTFEPLTETQLWILSEAEKLYPKGGYFFSEQGKNHNKIYTILKNASKELNIPYGRDVLGGFVIHDFRHTFVTNLMQNGLDFKTAQDYSGHSADNMLMRYSHVTSDSKKKASEIIENKLSLNGKSGNNRLKEIFDSVVSGKMKFEEFEKKVKELF